MKKNWGLIILYGYILTVVWALAYLSSINFWEWWLVPALITSMAIAFNAATWIHCHGK